MAAKFHLDKNGQAAQCKALKRACPLKGEHYDTYEEALRASSEQSHPGRDDLTTRVDLSTEEVARLDAALTAAGMTREELYGSLRYDFDPLTTGGTHPTRLLRELANDPERLAEEIDQAGGGRGAYFYKEFPHYADELADALPPREVQDSLTEDFDTKEKHFKSEFYKGLDEARNNGLAGTGELLHRLATRSANRAGLNDYEKVVATNRLTQQHWKQDLYKHPEPARVPEVEAPHSETSAGSYEDHRDPRHYYGPMKGKVSLDVAEAPASSSSEPKELDPEMIEALKAKYLKKFKVPFDESGLSIPELLQMAQKGELD